MKTIIKRMAAIAAVSALSVGTLTVSPTVFAANADITGQYLEMAGLNAAQDSKYIAPGSSGMDAAYFGLTAYNMDEKIITMRGKYELSDALAEIATPYLTGEGNDAFIEAYDFLYGGGASWYVNPAQLIFAVSSTDLCEDLFADGELIFGAVYEIADEATVDATAEKYGIKATQEEDGTWVYKFPIYLDASYENWEWVGEDEKNHYPDSVSLSETSYIYILTKEPEGGSDFLRGDVNQDGAVAVSDATLALQIYAAQAAGMDTSKFTAEQIEIADVDEDGKVTLKDASYILAYYSQNAAGLNPTWETLIK